MTIVVIVFTNCTQFKLQPNLNNKSSGKRKSLDETGDPEMKITNKSRKSGNAARKLNVSPRISMKMFDR